MSLSLFDAFYVYVEIVSRVPLPPEARPARWRFYVRGLASYENEDLVLFETPLFAENENADVWISEKLDEILERAFGSREVAGTMRRSIVRLVRRSVLGQLPPDLDRATYGVEVHRIPIQYARDPKLLRLIGRSKLLS